jgi:hypothetical protein
MIGSRRVTEGSVAQRDDVCGAALQRGEPSELESKPGGVVLWGFGRE